MSKSLTPKIDNGVGYISASREGMYSKCKFQFYDQVVVNCHDQYSDDHEDSMDDAIYLMFGKAMHKTLELFHKNKCTKKSELKALYRENYIDFGVDDKDYHYLGLEMCETYWGYLKTVAPKRVLVATELFFRVVLGKDKYGNDVYGQGTIDAVFYHGNGLYEIVDYKTSNWLPSRDELEANTQISMYDIALRSPEMKEHWYKGIEPKAILLTMNYLRFEDGVLQTEIDDDWRECNRMYFIDTYTQMNTKRKEFFVCKVNTMCPYCDSKDRCPKYQEILAGKIAEDDEDDVALLTFSEDNFAENTRAIARYKGMLKILQSQIDDLNYECQEYIKKNDVDVIVDGVRYFLGNSSRRYLLPMITIKILKQYGMWDEKDFISSIPITKVEKMCKDRPEVWDALSVKAVKRSFGQATIQSRKVPKGLLFKERRSNKKNKR